MESNQLRFLESVENIKALVHLRVGRQLSTSRAREISACIQQGRQFFDASSTAPLEIRPLVQFYGLVGFAKALILAHKLCSLSSLAASHGLRDVTAPGARIAELAAVIEARGTFVDFNDTVGPLNRLRYVDAETHPAKASVPTASSASLSGVQITLKDILARSPALSKLYRYTFNEPPSTEALEHPYFDASLSCWTTRLVDDQRLDSRGALYAIVGRWRARFPYLSRWRVIEAAPAWGASYITLANLEHGLDDDLEAVSLPETKSNHYAATMPNLSPDDPRIPLEQLFLGVGGGYSTGGAYAIAPYAGQYISEFSLAYVGLFLLSSLVRYRPDVWTHAVSRSALQDRPIDDRALSLIQAFLAETHAAIPRLVVQALNPHEDDYA